MKALLNAIQRVAKGEAKDLHEAQLRDMADEVIKEYAADEVSYPEFWGCVERIQRFVEVLGWQTADAAKHQVVKMGLTMDPSVVHGSNPGGKY